MAMKDIFNVTVDPSKRNEAIMLYQSFGWDYKSENEVKTNDSQFLTKSTEEYNEYTTIKGTHYIRINFERDQTRQNYAELKSLEEQYFAIKDPYCPDLPRFVTKVWLILIGIGLVAYVIPGIILLVIRIIVYVKKKKQFDEDYVSYTKKMDEIRVQREEILAKAQALV